VSSFDVLRTYLEARASFTEDEFAFMRDQFIQTTLPAGEVLQRAGDVARHAAFVASGCLRSYVIDASGKEHIVQFAPETWWLALSTRRSCNAFPDMRWRSAPGCKSTTRPRTSAS
jgi:CRP-like cAMP-binding protein